MDEYYGVVPEGVSDVNSGALLFWIAIKTGPAITYKEEYS
jgi:hypothetical protein